LRQRDYYNYIIEARPKRYFNPVLRFYQLLELNDIKAEVACTLVLLNESILGSILSE
jgi:hypothetical protein